MKLTVSLPKISQQDSVTPNELRSVSSMPSHVGLRNKRVSYGAVAAGAIWTVLSVESTLAFGIGQRQRLAASATSPARKTSPYCAPHHTLGLLRQQASCGSAQSVPRNLPWQKSVSSSRDDISLSTTTSDDSLETVDNDLRQHYRWSQYIFMSTAALIFVLPDRTMTTLLATKWGGACGYALAAGLCRVLESAAIAQRLSSDTYRRLNLGLAAFCGLSVTAVPGEAAFLNSVRATGVLVAFLTAVRFWGLVIALRGWTHGLGIRLGGDDGAARAMLLQLARGTRETVSGFLRVQSPKKALTYRNCLGLVGIGMVSSFMEGLFHIRYRNEFVRTWFEISLQWSAVARLAMIATIIYSLKDAAERDRLSGSTFIELNVMVGAWALVVGFGQAIYPLGFAAHRGVLMFAFSASFFLKAYRSYKEKQKINP
jgi:hypothetical protein